MKDKQLKDIQIGAIIKAALDNNAAIIQYCTLINGMAEYAKPSLREQWHKDLTTQWKAYEKQINDLLGDSHEQMAQ